MLWGHLERLTGIEPAYQAWEASALPLSYSRSGTGLNSSRESRSTRFTLPQSGAPAEYTSPGCAQKPEVSGVPGILWHRALTSQLVFVPRRRGVGIQAKQDR